jgi:hypothetical protein
LSHKSNHSQGLDHLDDICLGLHLANRFFKSGSFGACTVTAATEDVLKSIHGIFTLLVDS